MKNNKTKEAFTPTESEAATATKDTKGDEHELFEERIKSQTGEELDRLKNMIKIPEEELQTKGIEYMIASLKSSVAILCSEREKMKAFQQEQANWIALLEYKLAGLGHDDLKFLTAADSFKYAQLESKINEMKQEFHSAMKLEFKKAFDMKAE